MNGVRRALVAAQRIPVRLNLAELEALCEAGIEAGGADPRERDLHAACVRIERARIRRERTVRRAAWCWQRRENGEA